MADTEAVMDLASGSSASAFGSILRTIATLCQAIREEGTATSGGAAALADTVNLSGYSDDTFNDQFLYIWQGTGIGQERRIQDFANSGDSLTVGAWTTAPDSTSKYLILQPNWRMTTIREAFKTALRMRRSYYLLPTVDDSLELVVTAGVPTYEYTVPSNIAAIEYILRENTEGGSDFWTPLPPDCWFILKAATRKLVFEKAGNNALGFMADGLKLRLVGQKYQVEPTADSDTISIEVGALTLLAASLALQTMRAHDVQNARGYAAQASILQQTWLASRGDDETVVSPGSRLVD